MPTYFTIREANQALPQVADKYRHTIACKEEIMRAEKELQEGGMRSFADYSRLKQHLNSCMTKFYGAIEALESTGVVVKSLDEGLLDFPSKRFDDEIWLCWKAGESEIKFWHERDAGFDGRKPLEVSDESLV